MTYFWISASRIVNTAVNKAASNVIKKAALGRLLFACAVLTLGASAWAAPIDPSASELKATFRQFNVPVTGDFKQFEGDIQYDPAKPAATTASLKVKTASYDLGDAAYNAEVAGKDWFDSKKHPEASFALTSVAPKGDAFEAKGELSLRGVTKPVAFPAMVKKVDGKYIFTGKATIKRLDFGVGQGDWADTSLVEDPVVIEFKLVSPAK